MQVRLISSLAAIALAASFATAPALAAGDGGSSGSSTPVTQCKKGMVWDKKKKKCVVPGQGLLDDDSIYESGRDLAKAGRYDEAITILSFAANKRDPRILNYLGYSHRKAGRVLVGLGYYQEALINDPHYTLVREYLGEAHLQLGDVAAARVQLDEIRKRCGTVCSEYDELSDQIDAYVKG